MPLAFSTSARAMSHETQLPSLPNGIVMRLGRSGHGVCGDSPQRIVSLRRSARHEEEPRALQVGEPRQLVQEPTASASAAHAKVQLQC